MTLLAQSQQMSDTAYAHMIAARKARRSKDQCIEDTVTALMEGFSCARRRAVLLAISTWNDLEAAGKPLAYIDVSQTTGNTVVVRDFSGKTNVFSIHELLELRNQNQEQLTRIQA